MDKGFVDQSRVRIFKESHTWKRGRGRGERFGAASEEEAGGGGGG